MIDLDRNTFEIFKGFQKEPPPEGERFAEASSNDQNPGYYPVKHVISYPLDALPTQSRMERDIRFRTKGED